MEVAIRPDFAGEVEDLRRSRIFFAWSVWIIPQQRRAIRRGPAETFLESLLAEGLNRPALLACESSLDWIGKDEDITIQLRRMLRLGQCAFNWRGPFNSRGGPNKLLRRVFGFDHGTAKIPTALDVETHFESEAIGFSEGVLVKLAPLRRKKSWTVRNGRIAILGSAACIADESAAEALGLHLLEVAGDGCLGYVAVEPPPIGAKLRVVRRIVKPRFQLIRQGKGDTQGQGGQKKHRAQPTSTWRVQICF